MSNSIRAVLAGLMAALALAGCGKAEKKVVVDTKQFVVTSAVDCADNAGLSYEVCAEIIAKAVDHHEKSAASFTTLAACEKGEGAGKCERIDERAFRPRLTAFHLTLSEPPVAAPLYPTKSAAVGFRTAGNADMLTDNEGYTFTKSASDAAELYKSNKKVHKSAF